MNNYDQAAAYIHALTGDPTNTVMDWRCLHDSDRTVPGHARRGTLLEWWDWLVGMNQQGYGCFVTPAVLDGQGRELQNVTAVRAHYVDLDDLSAQQNYERAAAWQPAPCFAVDSSAVYKDDGTIDRIKRHVYWPISQPYRDNDRFSAIQRKLRQLFSGDKAVIDATRVMRLPGTYNVKDPSRPWLVSCHSLPGYLQRTPVETLEQALAHVNVIDGGSGTRHDLGEPSLAAPSLEWLKHALDLVDPNTLDRLEWIALTSAIKQAGWTLTDPDSLYNMWAEWCARYVSNDTGENHKQWHSIRNTELGWPSLVRRVPSLRAALTFGGQQVTAPVAPASALPLPQQGVGANTPPMPVAQPPALDCSGEMLTHVECEAYFAGCVFVTTRGEILTPDGRLLNVSKFNGAFGGKQFIISSGGKVTDEPWKAATRSTMWTVPKVDHLRFLPHEPTNAIVTDHLGRKGVNMYKPPVIPRQSGDPTPFLNHIGALIPDQGDQAILLDFLAYNLKFPGDKIPWAPVIQSCEGAGKGVIKLIMTRAFGTPYVHFPNAKDLVDSGSKFNAWMRNKLFILADEIKVDDKRDLIEVLKPMISETAIEVQSKGVDQELEDNYANWLFFTNYKDAVPVSKNGRRYAIFYSPIQTEAMLLAMGMGEEYFNRLYSWLKGDGASIVIDYLMNRPIERGAIPMRAPKTSSWDEAVKIGRTPAERVIQEAIEDGLPGFRGGWVSVASAEKRIKDTGAARGNLPPHVITGILESMGYVAVDRAPRPFFQEGNGDSGRSMLYHLGGWANVSTFGRLQGWE